jgi:hypothetical protein
MRAGPDHRRDAASHICGVEPHPGEPVAPVRQAHVGVLTGPAQRHCLDVLLAVVLPHDPNHGRHRPAERVLGHTGAGRVEDALSASLPRRRRLDVLHTSSVEHMFGCI